jgi:hypothetical protein
MTPEKARIGFVYDFEVLDNGILIAQQRQIHNIMPTVALNHLLDVLLKGGTQYANWYVGLFESNYTPVAGTTMASLIADATECTAYSETGRPGCTLGTVSGGAVDNSASKAEFTFTGDKTIYGGFMASNNVKGANTGMLVSAVRAGTAISVQSGNVLRVTAGITLTSE